MARTRKGGRRSARSRASRATQEFRFEAWPTEFRTITQHFGARPTFYAKYGLPGHEGIDFQAPDGARVFCVAPGTVLRVQQDDGTHNYGCHVRVEHEGGYTSIYAHLQEAQVRDGDVVQAGQVVGLAGQTGNTEGPHLHLTLKKKRARHGGYPNNIIDPTPFVNALLEPDEAHFGEWDDAQYVRDTVPDGTSMPAHQSFDQTWFLRNSGGSTWDGFELAHIGGPTMEAPPAVPLPNTPPGGEVPVTVAFKAPAQPGRHRSVWQPRDEGDAPFGDPVWVEIEVPGAVPGVTPAPDGVAPPHFVQVGGRSLVLDGRPFRFIGANLRGLVHYGRRTSDPLKFSRLEHRESQLREGRRMGVRVARLFLPDKDVSFDEIELRLRETLDIVKGQFPDMFLLPAFTNLYNDVPFFVPGDDGFFATPPGDNRDLLNRAFFADGYRQHYLPFVEQIVTAFRGEPNILAWEIGNELKLDRANKDDANDPNPALFVRFNHDVASHIKRLDPHHLVTTGMKSTHHAWLHTPALQEELYSSPNIDFITIHSYEGMWDQEGDRRVYDDAPLAARLGKPFVVEETGFDVRVFPDRLPKYEEHMRAWFDLGASGYMPWGFNHQREIGDGDVDVGIGVSHGDSSSLFELFRRTAGDIEAGRRALRPAGRGVARRVSRETSRSLAGFNFTAFNKSYLDNENGKPISDAEGYGVRVVPAGVLPGQTYWNVIGIHHLSPQENTGKRNAFVEILDETGQRVHDPGLQLQWGWEGQGADQPSPPRAFDKGDDEPATNLDLYAGQHVWLRIGGGLASDIVENIHTDHPDEPGPGGELWSSRGHHSFYVVFQRTRADEAQAGVPVDEGEEAGGAPAENGGPPVQPIERPQPVVSPAQPVKAIRAGAKIGIDANAPIDAGSGEIAPQVRDPVIIAATGAGWVRLNFILGSQWSSPSDQARPHGLTWAETYRNIIDGFLSRGLKVYGLIGDEAVREPIGNRFRNAPVPADSGMEDDWIQQYANTFVEIARLFKGDVAVFESFNEPDDWHGEQSNWVHPGWFAAMLEAVHNAVRSDPALRHTTLVSGPLQGLEGENKGNGAQDYLDRTYQAGRALFGWGTGGKPFPFDGVGYHLYVHERFLPDPVAQERAIRTTYRRYLDEMRGVVRSHEGREKPLFISEMGWFTNGDRESMEEFQADSLQSALKCLVEEPSVALAVNFCMQDFGRPQDGKYYGLYRPGDLGAGNRKQSFQALRSVCEQPVPHAWLAHTPGIVRKPQDGATYIPGRDAIADGSVVQRGQPFTQTWHVRNTGERSWTSGYKVVWTAGPSLGAAAQVPVPACDPGQEAPISVTFTAPAEPGRYRSVWQLCNADDETFGERFWVEIEVADMAMPGIARADTVGRRIDAPEALMAALSKERIADGDRLPALASLGIIYTAFWARLAGADRAADPAERQRLIDEAVRDALRQIRASMGQHSS